MLHRAFRLFLLAVAIAVCSPTAPVWAAAAEPSPAVDFQRDVRPILSNNCFACHGPDEATRQADLRLDTRDGAFSQRPPAGRSSRPRGPAVVPGDTGASLLVERIHHSDPLRRMPPEVSQKSLSGEQVETLTRWIEQGAPWDEHWSFAAIERPAPPAVEDEAWARDPLDRFILARLEADELTPAEEANRRTLARRAALDLTGLPPDPGTLATFLGDTEEGAYERLVDRLLASPHWGEHRARYWLDAARYGDTHGIHIDNYREMYAYRDWAIQAFNRNQPFDQFTLDQIAGDLLPEPTLDQLIATGFQRNNITTNEGGVVIEEYEAIYAKDRAETIGSVFMGLTVGCATCHDHKFDPISQREFYALTAFFRNTTQYVMDGNISDPPPTLVVPRDEDRETWYRLREEVGEIEDALAKRLGAAEPAFADWLASDAHRELDAPLGTDAEILRLDLDGGAEPAVIVDGDRKAISLHGEVRIEPGPNGLPALLFGDKTSAELPPLEIDTDTPFSLAMWIYMPEAEGSYTVASQSDPHDADRGWQVTLGARELYFRLRGDRAGPGRGATSVSINPNNTQRLTPGEWTHIVFTHDGSGERGGLHIYRDGARVPEQGSEFFARVQGRIRTDRPFYLGRHDRRTEGSAQYFAGGGVADVRVFDRVLSVEEARVVSEWSAIRAAAAKRETELSAGERQALLLSYVNTNDEEYRRLATRRLEIDAEWRELRRHGTVTHVMQELPGSEPAAHVLYRGNYDQPRERVLATTPAALPPMPEDLPRNRLGLAHWLVDETNPLMARVTVNRFWQQVFGTGLVVTSEDFGAQGDVPSHPELLDYLATEFRESDWDVKGFFRRLVTSSTYRQAATVTPHKLARDPDNRLLSRGPRFRMDAEMVRDTALAASGLLVRTIGGPSVKPYQPEGHWRRVAMNSSNTYRYQRDSGDKLYRRSLYTFWKRAAPPPSMTIFDAGNREHSVVRRERTNTPLQALVTMNDTQFVEASRFLAQRAMREAGDDFDRRLDYVTTRLLARDFGDSERAVARRTYDGLLDLYAADEAAARQLVDVGESAHDAGLPLDESAAWTMLASQLMNLDETLNK
ncbi:MAG: DUF1553 domain-containing protein [Acidobacteriota bacterium]|nr:DUF1553 domain-containing protein [Acidobacteriota bacterium]MDE3263442.1 DUF1553 domain-containing protein [Acidobacteriota bacterium]